MVIKQSLINQGLPVLSTAMLLVVNPNDLLQMLNWIM